jgi:hypothetical protein
VGVIKIILVDREGIGLWLDYFVRLHHSIQGPLTFVGSMDKDETYDAKIFALAVLLSYSFITTLLES